MNRQGEQVDRRWVLIGRQVGRLEKGGYGDENIRFGKTHQVSKLFRQFRHQEVYHSGGKNNEILFSVHMEK